jgi:hypothetical protein
MDGVVVPQRVARCDQRVGSIVVCDYFAVAVVEGEIEFLGRDAGSINGIGICYGLETVVRSSV